MVVDEAIDGIWPVEDLDVLGACPACNSEERKVLFERLTDRVFRAAPGRWTLWRCGGCGVAYLDPRPSEESIGRAYANYYTHIDEPVGKNSLLDSVKGRVKQGLRNSYLNFYLNFALGHRPPHAFPARIGALAAKLFPDRFRGVEYWARHLPPAASGDARLLDIGCGNGAFLRIASALGYETFGLEPDEEAAAIARRYATEVRVATLPGSGFPEAAFSQITLNHVIEHLHRPCEALAEILRLLAPGGRVWLTQPNLSALGLIEFGPDWRGLEPPRHLVLFSPGSLADLLGRLGFTRIRVLPCPTAMFYYPQSVSIRDGENPYAAGAPTGWNSKLHAQAAAADRAAARNPCLGESFTVIGFRP